MATFLREAEEFLARLPSINLDGVDPSVQQPLKAGPLSSLAPVATGQPVLLLDPKHGACTITTGPKPAYEKRPRGGSTQDYLMTKGSGARPSSSTYSPSCTLYPLTSLESYSNAGGNSADSQDLDIDMDMGDISMGTGLHDGARGSGQTGSAESDAAEELGLRRSSRTSGSRKDKAPKEKRKVGRPIAYCGDPDSPDLTPAERRRIKRRIANRESARRVRARRQEQIEEMAVKAQEMERHNMQLATHATSVEGQHGAMMRQLGEYTARLRATSAQNEALQAEIAQLRAFIQSKGMKTEESGAPEPCPEATASAAGSTESLPANHSSLGHIASNPSGCDAPTSGLQGRRAPSFGNSMQSAFATAAQHNTAPGSARDGPVSGGVAGAVLQMPDMPLRGGSRASSGALLLALGGAASIDQLLPPMDPLGMSLNEFLLGEAC